MSSNASHLTDGKDLEVSLKVDLSERTAAFRRILAIRKRHGIVGSFGDQEAKLLADKLERVIAAMSTDTAAKKSV